MSTVKKAIQSLSYNRFSWALLKPFAKLGYILWTAREQADKNLAFNREAKNRELQFAALFKDMTVLHGPFKGIRYPSLNSFGSSLFAKLLGSYEREIHPVIEEVCSKSYSEIINIGCGEGYYSVGLAKRLLMAKVFAYDIDSTARALSVKMAEHNGVQDRIEVRSEMTALELGNFKFTSKGLIFCDCEGYEKRLFNPTNIANLRNADLVIETHDFIDLEISSYLKTLFEKSHDLTIIRSVDDIQKVKDYHYEEIESFNIHDRKFLLHEGRPAVMEWLYLRSKSTT